MGDKRTSTITRHELELGERTLRSLETLCGKPQGSDAVLTAINNLTNFVKETLMGLKEDVETLKEKFDTLESAALAVADDIAALKNELKEANDRANIDLSPFIERAGNMEAGLRAAAGPQAGTDPEPTPAPEPTPTEPTA